MIPEACARPGLLCVSGVPVSFSLESAPPLPARKKRKRMVFLTDSECFLFLLHALHGCMESFLDSGEIMFAAGSFLNFVVLSSHGGLLVFDEVSVKMKIPFP